MSLCAKEISSYPTQRSNQRILATQFLTSTRRLNIYVSAIQLDYYLRLLKRAVIFLKKRLLKILPHDLTERTDPNSAPKPAGDRETYER